MGFKTPRFSANMNFQGFVAVSLLSFLSFGSSFGSSSGLANWTTWSASLLWKLPLLLHRQEAVSGKLLQAVQARLAMNGPSGSYSWRLSWATSCALQGKWKPPYRCWGSAEWWLVNSPEAEECVNDQGGLRDKLSWCCMNIYLRDRMQELSCERHLLPPTPCLWSMWNRLVSLSRSTVLGL